jgi:hypothetical protein
MSEPGSKGCKDPAIKIGLWSAFGVLVTIGTAIAWLTDAFA